MDGSLNDIAVAGFSGDRVDSQVPSLDIDGAGTRDLIVGRVDSLPGTHWFIPMADLNGDGFHDFVAGCPFGYDQSDVFVVHGPIARGPHELLDVATFEVTSTTFPQEHIGYTWRCSTSTTTEMPSWPTGRRQEGPTTPPRATWRGSS